MAESPQLLLIVSAPGRFDTLLLAELRKSFPDLSRAQLREAFRVHAVELMGQPEARASQALEPGQYSVSFKNWDPAKLSERNALCASPEDLASGITPSVVYEDNELLVLNKPSGIPSAPLRTTESRTAVGFALHHCPALRQVGRGGLEPGILHRLDTATSGLLAFAKNNDAYEFWVQAWKARQVRKHYRAIAPRPQRQLKLPARLSILLAHDANSDKRMRVWSEQEPPTRFRGKKLETVTWIRATREIAGTPLLDFEIEIETGVMHQIRCVLASLGSPILGDPIYEGGQAPRLWLHASALSLPRYRQTGFLSLESALPRGWPGT